MKLWVGTSGYNYPEWKGSFYPQKMPAAQDAALSTPSASDASRSTTPSTGCRIRRSSPAGSSATPERLPPDAEGAQAHHAHRASCATAAKLLQHFLTAAATLGPQARRAAVPAAALLAQGSAPCSMRFLALLPPQAVRRVRVPPCVLVGRRGVRAPASAQPRTVHRRQREVLDARCEVTASYGYFRLRDEGYTPTDIERWARTHPRPAPAHCSDVFVYFKHEEAGKGPQFARLLLQAMST